MKSTLFGEVKPLVKNHQGGDGRGNPSASHFSQLYVENNDLYLKDCNHYKLLGNSQEITAR